MPLAIVDVDIGNNIVATDVKNETAKTQIDNLHFKMEFRVIVRPYPL